MVEIIIFIVITYFLRIYTYASKQNKKEQMING